MFAITKTIVKVQSPNTDKNKKNLLSDSSYNLDRGLFVPLEFVVVTDPGDGEEEVTIVAPLIVGVVVVAVEHTKVVETAMGPRFGAFKLGAGVELFPPLLPPISLSESFVLSNLEAELVSEGIPAKPGPLGGLLRFARWFD